jgi:hypothetical protein
MAVNPGGDPNQLGALRMLAGSATGCNVTVMWSTGLSLRCWMERMIRDQLKGTMHFDWHADGLACEIVLPLQ